MSVGGPGSRIRASDLSRARPLIHGLAVQSRRIDTCLGSHSYGPVVGPQASVPLDGMAGAILDGLVADGAVWATIRHELRRGAENRTEAPTRHCGERNNPSGLRRR